MKRAAVPISDPLLRRLVAAWPNVDAGLQAVIEAAVVQIESRRAGALAEYVDRDSGIGR
ncbi:MAG: hypothetical protein IT454_13680 [Planctomycetes bacterium]|nr:hypothetical protein [Planctomycetota bacterium]